MQWAANAGVVAGMGDGTFAPNADITREQMAVMLYRYIVLSAIPLYKSDTIPFGDYAEKSYWAVASVEAIQAAGIIAGFPDGTFRPQESATRAEVATIFARFLVMLNNDMN